MEKEQTYYNNVRGEMPHKNIAYDFFRVNRISFDIPLIKTKWRNIESENSLTIDVYDKARLESIFNTNIPEEHWNKVVKEHRMEKRRFFTLHSSALTSLLCFHSITQENPISIPVGNETSLFDEVEFEKPNSCINKAHPSCIDVTLKNEATKQILFLECKFSEYLHNGKTSNISSQYHSYYKKYAKLLPKELMFEGMENASAPKAITTSSGRCRHYCEGIKQMLSHHIGACNFIKDSDNRYIVYLGSIVFDFSRCSYSSITNLGTMEAKIKDYSCLYQQLAKGLNSLTSDVIVLPSLLTYQNVFHNNPDLLSDRIKEFYHLY